MKLEIGLEILQFQTKKHHLKNQSMSIHTITKCKTALTLQLPLDSPCILFLMPKHNNLKQAVYSLDSNRLNQIMIFLKKYKTSYKNQGKTFQTEISAH
jgi:hypothetical protein